MDQKSENDNFEEGEIAESSPTFPEFSDQLSSGKNLPLSSRLAGGQTPKQNRPDSRYPDARNSNPMLMGSLPTSRPPQPPVPPVIRSTSREQLHHGYNNSQDRYDGPAPIYRDNRGSGGYSERDSLGGGDWVDPRSEYGWSEPSYGPHGVDDWSGPPRDYHDSRDAGGYYDQAPRGPHLQQRYPPIARGSSTGALNSYDQQASLDHRGNPNARGYGSGGPGYSGSSSSGHPTGDYPSAYPPSGPVQLGGRPHSDSRDGSFYDVATGPGSAPAITPRDYKKDLAPPSYEKNPFLNSGGAAAAAKGSLRPAPGAGSHSPPKLKRASSDGDVPTNSSSSGPPLPVYNASNKPLPPNIGKTSAPTSQAPVKVPIPGSTLHTSQQTAQTAAVKPPPPPPMRPNVNNPNAPAPPQLKTSQSSGNLSNQPTSAVSTSDQQVKSSQQPPPPAPKPPSRPLAPVVDSSASGGNSNSSGANQQARPSSHHKIPPPPEPVPPPATLFDTLMKFGQGGSSSTGGVSGTGVGGNRPLIKVVTGSDAVVNPEHSKVFNSTAPINITAGALAAAATSAGAGGSNSSNLEKHLAVGTSSFAYESSLSSTTPKPISLGAAALDKIGLQPRSSSSSSASSSQNDLVSFSFMSNSVSNSTGNANNNSSAALSALDPSAALTATPGGAKSLSVSETPKASGIAETLMTPTSSTLGGSAVRRPRAAWGSGLIRQTSTSSVVDAVVVPETPAAVTAPDTTAAESTATAVAADTAPFPAKPGAGESKTPAASEVKVEAKTEPRVEPKVERVAEKVNVKPEATTGTTSAVDKAGKPNSASSSVNKDVKVVPPPSGPLSRVNSAQDVNAAPSAPASKGTQQTPSQIARKNLQQEKLAAAQQAEQKATQLAAQKQHELQRLEQRKKERSASQTDGLVATGASSKKETKESRETKELKETKQEEEEEMDFDAADPVAAVPAAPLTLTTPKNTPKTTAKKTMKPATPIATPVAAPVPAVVVATETKMETTKVETSKVESKPIKKAALPVAAKSESDGSEESGNDSDGSTESATAKLQPPVKKVKTETAAPVTTTASSSGAVSTAAATKEQESLQQAKKRKRDSAAGASGESAAEEGDNGAAGESEAEQEAGATTGGTSPRKVIRFTPTAGENKTEPTDSAADSAVATSPRKRPNNNKVAVALEISAADREALSVITGRGLPRPDLLPGSKKRGRPFAANSKRNPALRDTDDDTAAADGEGEGNDSRPESDAVSANAEQAAAQRKKERARVSDKADKTDKQFGRGRPSTSSQYPTGSGSVKDNERLTAAQMVQQLLAAPPAKLNNKEKKALKERFMLGNLFSKETDVQRACHAIFCMNQLLKGTENNAGGGTGVATTTASTGAANSSSTAGAKDTKDGAVAPNPHPNYPFMTQDFSSIHSAHKVFIPTAAEISTFIDFLDGSSDMLYMYMKGIREKQYMSEAVRKDQHTAEQATTATATVTAEGDKKVSASDSDSSDVADKTAQDESTTATTIAAPTTTTADGADAADVVSSAASANEKVSEKATLVSESDAPAPVPEGPKIKHNTNPPNLLELQHNNQLRIVEAHLFATIINNVSSVVNNNAPTFVAPYAATSSKVTTSGTAPVASGSSNSSTSGNGNKSNNSKDSNSSGNKSSRKGSSTAAPTAAESTAPASTPIVSITDAVNQYMHNSIPVVYFDPQDLPQYTHNVKKMERNRESITREIRARKLHKRRAWEYLGDKYLDIHHKWDTHMTDVEKEEEAAATRDGPKLRNAVNTLSMRPFTEVNKNTSLPSLFSLSNGAAGVAGTGAGVIGRPGALSAATGAANTPGVVSIGGLTASFTNNQLNITSMNGSIANNSLFSNATTGANTSFNSRATGLGIARTDYEQEQLLQTLFASEIRQMKINNGLCEIPDMLSPWPYADNYKPPAMPKWNKNIREFVTGGKNAIKDSAAGATAGDNKASKAAAKKSAVSGTVEGDSTEVKTEASAQKAEVKVESTGAVKGTENKTVAVPAPRPQNAVAPDAPFPTFKHCYTEYFDTNGSRLTTDGKRQLCCNIPLHNSCPMNCNCALQVDRLAKFERIWTDIEKCIFIDKFMQFPKNFQKIASFLTNRTTKDCIKFYYDSKHTVEYKALLKEFDSRRKTNNKFSWVQTVKAAQYVGAAVYPSSNDNIADPSSKNSIIELPIDDLICSSFTNQPANIARLFNIPIPKLYSIHTPVQLATEQQLHTMATTNIGTGKTTLLRNNSTDGDNSNNSNNNDNQQNATQQNYFHNGITMPQAIASRSQITQPYPRQSTINTAKRLYSATHNGANLDDVIASALQQETNDTSDNETDAPPAATQAAAPTPKETTRRKNKNKRQSSGGNQNNSSSSSSASFLPQYFNNGMLSKFPLGPDYSYIVHNERILNEAVIPSHFYGVAEHTAGESSNKQSDAVQRTYYHNAQLYSDFVSAAYNNNYASNGGSNNSGSSGSSSSSVNRLYDDVTSHTQAASLPNIPSVNVLNNTNRLPSAKKASTPRNPANKTSRVVKGPAPSGMPLPTTASGGSSASGGALINVPRFTPAANSAANATGAGSADGRVSGIAMMKPQTNPVVDANGIVVSRPAVLPVRRDLIAGRGNRGARRTGLASDRVVGGSNAANSGSGKSTAVLAQSGKETAKNVPATTANVTSATTATDKSVATAAKSAEAAEAVKKPTTEDMDVETPSADSAATKTADDGNNEIVVYAEESGTESEQEEGEGEDEEESASDGDNNDDDNDGEGDNADGDDQQSEDEDDAEANPTEQQEQQEEDEESESEVDEDGRPDLSNISRRLASDSESASSAGEDEEDGEDEVEQEQQRGVDAVEDAKPTAEQLDAADVMAEVVAAPTTASSNTGDEDEEGMETGHSDHEDEFPSEDVALEGASIEVVDQTLSKPVELPVSEVVATAPESVTPESNAPVASTAVPTHTDAVAAEEKGTEMLVDLDL